MEAKDKNVELVKCSRDADFCPVDCVAQIFYLSACLAEQKISYWAFGSSTYYIKICRA